MKACTDAEEKKTTYRCRMKNAGWYRAEGSSIGLLDGFSLELKI